MTNQRSFGRRVTALIPARAGSKGIPRKNVRLLGGKPLVAWTIEAAIDSSAVEHLYVSTNDPEVAVIAASYGCRVLRRPEDFSKDGSTADDVISHFLGETETSGIVVYLQPTSPLRNGADIDGAVDLLGTSGSEAVFSVRAARDKPEWMYRMGSNCILDPVLGEPHQGRRQDLANSYLLNGAIYAFQVSAFARTGRLHVLQASGYEMPSERSVDIDDEKEWIHAEASLSST